MFYLKLVLFISQLCIYSCDKIFCGDKLNSGVCYGEDKVNETTYKFVKPCPPGKYCSEENYIECIYKDQLVPPGGKCKHTVDCRTGKCKSNVCTPLKPGEPCDNDSECEVGMICTESGQICAERKTLDDTCEFWSNCKMGMECAGAIGDMRCIKLGTGKDGIIAETTKGCQNGYGIYIEDEDKYICVTLYNETSCQKDLSDGGYYCHGIIDKGDGNPQEGKLPCNNAWDGSYICPTEAVPAYQEYLEELSKELEQLKHQLGSRVDRYSFGIKSLGLKFLEFNYYATVHGADDCIKEFYYQYYLRQNFLNFSIHIVLFFFCLIY